MQPLRPPSGLYKEVRMKLGVERYPVLKNAFDSAHGIYGERRFGSTESIMHHLYQTADVLWSWGVPDEVIAAGVCHRFGNDELSAAHASSEGEVLVPVEGIVKAYRSMREFQPLSVQNRLCEPGLIRDNYWKMLLRHAAGKSELTEEQVFNGLVVMAADQLSTLRSAGLGYWETDFIDSQVYSYIALSSADLLRELAMEKEAGEIYDACLETLEPEHFGHLFTSFYGDKRDLAVIMNKVRLLVLGSLQRAPRSEFPSSIKNADISFSVHSRIKSLSSAAIKESKKGAGSVRDIIGLKVVVDLGSDCDSIDRLDHFDEARSNGLISQTELDAAHKQYYAAIDAVHLASARVLELAERKGWQEVEGSYDNYMARPKKNGYQSLQRSFSCGVDGKNVDVEIQIQTKGMHECSTWGEASHSRYKTGAKSETETAGSSIRERFSGLINSVLSADYGFSFGNGIEGPFELPLMKGREAVVLDLAFAIDPAWALKGAQFWRVPACGGEEEECTAGSRLYTGDMVRVVTSDKVIVSPQRLSLAGTAAARKGLYYALLIQNDRDPKKLFRQGSTQINRFILLETLSNICTINESAGLPDYTKHNFTISRIPEEHIMNKFGLTLTEELPIEVASGNARLIEEIKSNIFVLAGDPAKNCFWTACRNRALGWPAIRMLASGVTGLASFSCSIRDNAMVARYGLETPFEPERLKGIVDMAIAGHSEENPDNPFDRKKFSLKARFLLWDPDIIPGFLKALDQNGAEIYSCSIARWPDSGSRQAAYADASFAFRGSTSNKKIQALQSGIRSLFKTKHVQIE